MTMQAVEFKGLRVFADPDATRNAYMNVPDDRGCTCAYCRNLRPQLPTILGEEVRELLQQLNAHPLKPSEAIHYCREADGNHLYSVVYHFVGQLDPTQPMSEDRPTQSSKDLFTKTVDISSKYSLHFASAYFPHHKVFDGPNHVYVEVYIGGVPWVIDEKPDEAT